ncbi:alpha/beta fold hydrolase [Aspergillus stella-maris]|uniref:alpha/beta fold hydrolase n=1 Tax=Aspergillus stella-maris TaxID=1810926 RepID=UPI003CCE00CB
MAEIQYMTLSTKLTAKLSYTFHPPTTPTPPPTTPKLLVFLNGLGLPQTSWFPAITQLQESHSHSPSLPSILTYDRYGQGQSDRDPDDANAQDPSHGHDCMAVVSDLRQLISQIAAENLGINESQTDKIQLIFVANSIGCAIARLYAQTYTSTVAGMLLLDSVLANSDFVSVYPDPDDAEFDPSLLPSGITASDIRTEREGVRKIFHPSVGSKEGLSRSNLPDLLPSSSSPKLTGPNGGTWITVVGHDPEAFVEESSRMGRVRELTGKYVNPFWRKYNEGLVQLTEEGRGKGPVIAEGAGHFVQRDRPDFVVGELIEILGKVRE